MKFLREITEDVQIRVITESAGSEPSKYFLEGIFIQGDIPNRNGRKYPIGILDREVEKYTRQYINTNRAYGELGHPDTPTINLERVSHMIRSLKKEGNNYVGRAEILDTPTGNIVKAFMKAGASLGVSSRGVGSLKQEGAVNIVQDDFMLMTAADIVSDPSAPEAFVTAIMESREWVLEGGILVPVDVENYQNRIDASVASRTTDAEKLRIFRDFLSKL